MNYRLRPRNITYVCIMLVSLLWFGAHVVWAVDRYVSPPGGYGTNDTANGYTNWLGAATNIQWAVNVALAGETVRVTNGTYVLTNQITTKTNGVTIIGVNGLSNTFVNGNYPNTTNRCFCLTNHNVLLDGFTISNGFANINCQFGSKGGGIYLSNSGIVQRCTIQGNFVLGTGRYDSVGGGVYISDNYGKVLDCSISANINSNSYVDNVGLAGAGIYLEGGVVSNCSIFTNVALGALINGGGLGLGNENALAVNCNIYSNLCTYRGGGVYLGGGTLRNSVITRNTAKGDASAGADGVYMDQSPLYSGIPTMEGCLLYSNNKYGVYAYTAGLIRNCTITRNPNSGLTVNNSAVHVENTILAYNKSPDWHYITSPGTATNCCILTTDYPGGVASIPGSGNIANPPLFVSTNAGNYRLANNSPCINTGINKDWMTNAVDLDGRMRIRYGIVDMGAYERVHEATVYRFH